MKSKFFLMISALLLLLRVSGFAMNHEHTASGIKTDCDINAGACIKTSGKDNLQIALDINPKPVNTMSDLVLTVTVKKENLPVTDADVSLDLTMPGMFMGINRPVLKHVKDGRYEGKGVIPVCPHGGKLWKAEVLVKHSGGVETVSYLFEVE